MTLYVFSYLLPPNGDRRNILSSAWYLNWLLQYNAAYLSLFCNSSYFNTLLAKKSHNHNIVFQFQNHTKTLQCKEKSRTIFKLPAKNAGATRCPLHSIFWQLPLPSDSCELCLTLLIPKFMPINIIRKYWMMEILCWSAHQMSASVENAERKKRTKCLEIENTTISTRTR